MTATNVVRLKVPVAAKKVSAASKRQAKQQLLAGCAVSVVALTLTGLSLNHLAHGITIVTNAPMWESWSMAVIYAMTKVGAMMYRG